MQFRRSGQRDERRRKVLLDDTSADADNSPVPTNKTGKSDAVAKAYAQAAVDETETRVADLIPTRPLGVVVLLLLGLTAVAGVQAVYTFVPDWADILGDAGVAPFDLSRAGSLNGWLSASLFGVSAAMSLLIYVIRRHKMDDYRGRYRLWLWSAVGLILFSINAVAGLHHTADALVTHLAGRTLLTTAAGWSLVGFAAVGGVFGLQMLIDMWRSRGSSAALLSAGLIYAGATALVVIQPLSADPMLATMTTSLTFSLGHLTLALALTVYARCVLLEARGLLKVKKKQPKIKAKKEKKESAKNEARQEKNAAGRKVKIDPPHRADTRQDKADNRQPAQASPKSASSPSPAEDNGEADHHGPAEGSPEWLKLSKAQRRRIKKHRRRKSAAA